MAFKVLIWHSSPTLTEPADQIFWRFARVFGANNVVLTNTVPAGGDVLDYKCFLLLLPSPPADMPPAWQQAIASTDAFLTRLATAPPQGIRVIPVVSEAGEVPQINRWYPAFAGLASRQVAALDQQNFGKQLDRLVDEVQAFRRDTPLRRAAVYTSVLLAFGTLAVGMLSQFEDFFATYDATDVVVEVIDKDRIRLRGSTYPRTELTSEVRQRAGRRRNEPKIVLKFSEPLNYGDLALVAGELDRAGYKRLVLDVGGRESVDIRVGAAGPAQSRR